MEINYSKLQQFDRNWRLNSNINNKFEIRLLRGEIIPGGTWQNGTFLFFVPLFKMAQATRRAPWDFIRLPFVQFFLHFVTFVSN